MVLKYEISLCSVWWCPDCEDSRYFESIAAQTQYFLNLTGGVFSPLVNFPINNNVETVITYRDTSTKSIDALIASNYAVVRHKESEDGEYIYRYFFARCRQDSGRQIICELSLDDIQTNYFKYRTNINPAMINRAHLNRFVESGTEGQVTFNAAEDSPLFLAEGNTHAKRTTKLSKLLEASDDGSTAYEYKKVWAWLNEYVEYWVYVFLSADEYKSSASDNFTPPAVNYSPKSGGPNSEGTGDGAKGSIFSPGFACLVYPVYKNKLVGQRGVIKWRATASDTAESVGRLNFFSQNSNAKVYNYLISPIPPFPHDFVITLANVDENNNLILTGNITCPSSTTGNYNVFLFQNIQTPAGHTTNNEISIFLNFYFMTHKWKVQEDFIDMDFVFNKSDIIGANRNDSLNPKLLNSNFVTLSIGDGVASWKEYDLQKLNGIDSEIWSVSAITPDINTFYVGYKNQGIYIFEGFQTYNGALCQYDGTLPYTIDILDQYLASNKNFFLQKRLGYQSQWINQGLDAISGGVKTGNINVKSEGISGLKTLAGQAFDWANTELTLDNMRNAKDALQAANGTPLLNAALTGMSTPYDTGEDVPSYSGQGLYIMKQEALSGEIKVDADKMYLYGFSYYRIGNIADFDNIRHYFNYIEAEIYSIDAPISSLEEDRLKEKFRKGVRLWKSDTVQYDLENYEEWLAS